MPGRSGEQRLLDLLGLAARAGAIVVGTDMVRGAIRKGEVHFAILATDGSTTQRRKLAPLLEARGVPHGIHLERERLGAAVGRPPLSAIGLTDSAFARRAAELAVALSPPRE
ncbi:MAG: L7Ae/L30e/S12e/Gadd45 family ribosomal protein [Gemmatimonadota bacterium]|nr:L7Ae/L30e/S12e/Gadd45 family ribosomal protein [Gemmatimonadota bacterium]